MSDDPVVSVVLPVLDGRPYLEESLQSLQDQTFEDFEVIAVDGGSSDGSHEVLQRFVQADGRFRLVEAGGSNLPASLNSGIEAASGTYIARHDADDIAFEERLERQVSFMQDSDAFLSGERLDRCSVIGADGETVREPSHEAEPVRLNETIQQDCVLLHPSIMVRNEGFRYREKFFSVEDWDLYLRLIDAGKELFAVDEPLVRRRIHPDSMTTRAPERISYFAERALSFQEQREETGEDAYRAFEPDPPEQDIGQSRYGEKIRDAREKRG